MAKRRGGGILWDVDPNTGITSFGLKNIVSILGILVVLGVIGLIIFIVVKVVSQKGPETPSGGGGGEPKGGSVAPPMSQQPGRIDIAEVAQSPSAGQAIIYFSQAEASGTTCESCSADFDINIKYTGGRPVPSPAFKKVSASAVNGTVTFDYSVPTQTGGSTGPDVIPPTKIDVTITARSMNPQTGASGGPTSFRKTLPYVAQTKVYLYSNVF